MNFDVVKELLLWCTVANAVLLLWWFGWFMLAHDTVYRLHTRWFRLSVEQFDAIHYAGMAILKILTIVFFLVPYIVLELSA